jgi:hypothetical protein
MILNMAGGGANPLNFKVVGGMTKPTGFSDNTFWVNTPTAITSWAFTAEKPILDGDHIGIVETAGEFLGSYSDGTTAIIALKRNGGRAAVANCKVVIDGIEYGGEMLVSNDPDACTIALNESSGTTTTLIESLGTLELNGITYYYAYHFDQRYLQSGTWTYIEAESYEKLALIMAKVFSGDGMLWIKLDTKSNVSFNALKKNELRIYPSAVYQYVTGKYSCSWESKEAQIYIDREWVELTKWNGELYVAGNEYSSATGGWQARALDFSDSGNYVEALPTVTKHEDRIQFAFNSPGNCACGGIEIANDIDLTDWKTITLEFSGSTESGILSLAVIERSITDYQGNTKAQEQLLATGTSTEKKTVTLDISSVSGKYDIILYARLTLGSGTVDASMYSMKLSV